ncbi:MAG: hypothetical protein AAFU61_17345, partial [Pseudomonadota bacterium]
MLALTDGDVTVLTANILEAMTMAVNHAKNKGWERQLRNMIASGCLSHLKELAHHNHDKTFDEFCDIMRTQDGACGKTKIRFGTAVPPGAGSASAAEHHANAVNRRRGPAKPPQKKSGPCLMCGKAHDISNCKAFNALRKDYIHDENARLEDFRRRRHPAAAKPKAAESETTEPEAAKSTAATAEAPTPDAADDAVS